MSPLECPWFPRGGVELLIRQQLIDMGKGKWKNGKLRIIGDGSTGRKEPTSVASPCLAAGLSGAGGERMQNRAGDGEAGICDAYCSAMATARYRRDALAVLSLDSLSEFSLSRDAIWRCVSAFFASASAECSYLRINAAACDWRSCAFLP